MQRRSTRPAAVLAGFAFALIGATSAALAQCPGAGDCLSPGEDPGCDNTECCTTVCELNLLCCEIAWDADCVDLANQLCPQVCGSDVSGPCFIEHDTPGCSDPACCDAVCPIDPFCCEEAWDSTCVFTAGIVCATGGEFECGDAGAGDCFEPHANGACDDATCCDAVCQLDPTCCSTSWDQLCVALANQICVGGCTVTCPEDAIAELEACTSNENDPCFFPEMDSAPEVVECPVVICGVAREVVIPDVDVYEFELEDPDGDGLVRLELSFTAEFDGFAAVFPAGCENFDTAPFVVSSGKCVPGVVNECVAPGTWWVAIAPGTYPDPGDGTSSPCSDPIAYVLSIDCSDTCAPVCGAGGDCFEPHPEPGCDDASCCEAVCAKQPTCCDIAWDIFCASTAFELCNGTPPANDDCDACLPIGEGDTTFSTIGASSDGPALPAECDEGSGLLIGPDIWYCFEATCDGFAIVSTCGTANFDTRLAAYTGPCDDLELLACNDDGEGCVPDFTSRLNLFVSCGETYRIRVAGFADAVGTGTLSVTCIGDPCVAPCPADLDGNGLVDGGDLGILLGAWGTSGPGDLDGNGVVDGGDLGLLLGGWGDCGT